MAWLTPEQVLRIPTERLGLFILHRLTTLDDNQWELNNFTDGYLAETMPPTPHYTSVYTGNQLRAGREQLVVKIAEGWTWLEQQRYLITAGRPNERWRRLTAKGAEVLKLPLDAVLERIQAGELLGSRLHPRIEQIRELWNAGDFATAIFKAAREIEIAVGELLASVTPGAKKLYGVDVINAAFGPGKPLSDADQDRGEQEGMRALFAGFIATFKNPGSHRHFEPEDPMQAAEIIRTADLLMRMLDDIGERDTGD